MGNQNSDRAQGNWASSLDIDIVTVYNCCLHAKLILSHGPSASTTSETSPKKTVKPISILKTGFFLTFHALFNGHTFSDHSVNLDSIFKGVLSEQERADFNSEHGILSKFSCSFQWAHFQRSLGQP